MAQPRKSVAKDETQSSIIVRPYRDADESDVIALFVDHQEEGIPGAPINDALRAHITSTPALFTYASTVVGIGLLWTRYDGTIESLFPLARLASSSGSLVQRLKDVAIPVLATLVPLASALRFFLHRKVLRAAFTGYVTMSLGMDMKDIGAHYMGFDRSGRKGMQETSDDAASLRETIFWVAEDTQQRKLVGIVGLGNTVSTFHCYPTHCRHRCKSRQEPKYNRAAPHVCGFITSTKRCCSQAHSNSG